MAGTDHGQPVRPPTPIERFLSRDRRSTDEIYHDVVDSIALTPEYLITVIVSALIAALGMRSGQTAIVIGAMVIAPPCSGPPCPSPSPPSSATAPSPGVPVARSLSAPSACLSSRPCSAW